MAEINGITSAFTYLLHENGCWQEGFASSALNFDGFSAVRFSPSLTKIALVGYASDGANIKEYLVIASVSDITDTTIYELELEGDTTEAGFDDLILSQGIEYSDDFFLFILTKYSVKYIDLIDSS